MKRHEATNELFCNLHFDMMLAELSNSTDENDRRKAEQLQSDVIESLKFEREACAESERKKINADKEAKKNKVVNVAFTKPSFDVVYTSVIDDKIAALAPLILQAHDAKPMINRIRRGAKITREDEAALRACVTANDIAGTAMDLKVEIERAIEKSGVYSRINSRARSRSRSPSRSNSMRNSRSLPENDDDREVAEDEIVKFLVKKRMVTVTGSGGAMME